MLICLILKHFNKNQKKVLNFHSTENLLKTAQPLQSNKVTRQMTFPQTAMESSKPNDRPVKHLQDDDFVESAGLRRTSMSSKKSTAEKLLEQSLNTASNITKNEKNDSLLVRTPEKVSSESPEISKKLFF